MEGVGALGVLELSSIGRGIEAADAMLKKAAVSVVMSRVICPGKYLVLVTGTVEDVHDSIAAGRAVAGDSVVDYLVMTNPHPFLFPALTQTTSLDRVEALGIVESFTMCSALLAADKAAKRAEVSLMEVRLSIMLAGKSYVTLTGEESAVRSAVEAAAEPVRAQGLLLSAVVIPNPRQELQEYLV